LTSLTIDFAIRLEVYSRLKSIAPRPTKPGHRSSASGARERGSRSRGAGPFGTVRRGARAEAQARRHHGRIAGRCPFAAERVKGGGGGCSAPGQPNIAKEIRLIARHCCWVRVHGEARSEEPVSKSNPLRSTYSTALSGIRAGKKKQYLPWGLMRCVSPKTRGCSASAHGVGSQPTTPSVRSPRGLRGLRGRQPS
jgi:hypothetical protein